MSERRTRILLVEDDATDALLVQRRLGAPDGPAFPFVLFRSATLALGLERLAKGDIDVVLLDLALPDSQGVETVRRLREEDADAPIVVFTGAGEDEIALSALHAGAQDYLVKNELNESSLRRAIRYAIERQLLRRSSARLQEKLRRSQNLESLGVLAGGIAHDFNNLLTVILANAALAQRDLGPRDAARSPLNAVIEAARFASRLTDQLLAYSGGAGSQPESLDLSERIAEIERLLLNLMPDPVRLEFRLSSDLPSISADPNQLQQLAMNLVKNAAEAAGEAGFGRVELETGVVDLDEQLAAQAVSGTEIEPGPAVFLRVIDSGCGMTSSVAEKVFDPFFTTKLTGRGLGLPVCHGIVRSHGGALMVSTQPDHGTTVTAFFPLEDPSSWQARREDSATVLVVDDDDGVREVARLCLERFGYRVLEATGGFDAIEKVRSSARPIDAVLLDLTMPEPDGEQTFLAIQRIRPELPVLLTSGYDRRKVAERFATRRMAGFLPKPYEPEELAAAVARVLAEGPGAVQEPAGTDAG